MKWVGNAVALSVAFATAMALWLLCVCPASDIGSGDWSDPAVAEAVAVEFPQLGDPALSARVAAALDMAQDAVKQCSQDLTVFSNWEGRLPPQPRGYYREYTVYTPGVRGRGAQRLVLGSGGEVYFTADHYQSFVRLR